MDNPCYEKDTGIWTIKVEFVAFLKTTAVGIRLLFANSDARKFIPLKRRCFDLFDSCKSNDLSLKDKIKK